MEAGWLCCLGDVAQAVEIVVVPPAPAPILVGDVADQRIVRLQVVVMGERPAGRVERLRAAAVAPIVFSASRRPTLIVSRSVSSIVSPRLDVQRRKTRATMPGLEKRRRHHVDNGLRPNLSDRRDGTFNTDQTIGIVASTASRVRDDRFYRIVRVRRQSRRKRRLQPRELTLRKLARRGDPLGAQRCLVDLAFEV
jgi:hypothetical protein